MKRCPVFAFCHSLTWWKKPEYLWPPIYIFDGKPALQIFYPCMIRLKLACMESLLFSYYIENILWNMKDESSLTENLILFIFVQQMKNF